MIEQKINDFFGDAEGTGFGTGWWSGILSAFFGFLSFGAVLCLHFPQLLTSPELRAYYPMHLMRVLIQCLIVGAVLFYVFFCALVYDVARGLVEVVVPPALIRAAA